MLYIILYIKNTLYLFINMIKLNIYIVYSEELENRHTTINKNIVCGTGF